MAGLAGMAALPGMPPLPGGLPAVMPPMIPGLTTAVSGAGAGAAPQQATRFARRIYVGGLPPTSSEQGVTAFFTHALAAIGGNTAGPGSAVLNVYHNKEKNFAFVEFRTVEETSNSLALDGIMYDGMAIRVRRPNDYNAGAAVGLGPSQPSPALNLAAIGLGGAAVSGGGAAPGVGGMGGGGGGGGHHDDPNRIFIGGLPHYLTEEQVRELLQSFGEIRILEVIKDKDTGAGKGYGFVIYNDPSVTDIAVAGLNGLAMGDRNLTVRRANIPGVPGSHSTAPLPAGGLPPPPGMPGATGANLAPLGAYDAMGAAAGGATRIVVLENCVQREELGDDAEYAEIFQDMQDECVKYGNLIKLHIPRPADPEPPGVGKVIIEYAAVPSAVQARSTMHGRKFGGNPVIATYLSEEAYAAGEF
ncbi:MAG: hypothetical protein J3K34DRAFT_451352 [Monoraphidium minutum]|nr:MAG: hypothetical protein J3K34DRAFT_451352 [Monoraphidium minutum]